MYVHHIAITVKNLEESIKFYTSIFGFKQVKQFERGKAKIVFLQLNQFTIELYELPSVKALSDINAIDIVGIKHLAFSVENLDEAIKKARENGADFDEPQMGASGYMYAHGRDCNGITLELLEVTEEMKIDTAILYVKNLAESITFFHEKLGLTLEYQDGDRYASFIFEGDAQLGIIQSNAKEIENPGHNAVKIRVSNAAAIYKELQEKGVTFYKPLTIEPWATEFIVLDLDNNKIIMIERG